MRRLLLTLPLLALALTGCGDTVDDVTSTAGRVQDCAGLARDAVSSGLSGLPSPEQAEQAVRSLDDRIDDLGDQQVRTAAEGLRDRLQQVADAARDADPAAVERAVSDARDAAGEAAQTCGVPLGSFTG